MTVFMNVMGYIGALFISVAFLPQTYKLLKTKNTKGLSLTCYLVYHLGLTLFIIYASFIQNYPLLIANVFGWIVNICLVYLICYNLYQNKNKNNPSKQKNKNGVENATH